jgi:hypothetical protein
MPEEYPGQTRRAMRQLYLNLPNIPVPQTSLWEQFDSEQKRMVIETLARLMTQAVRANLHPEETDE